MNRIDLPKTQSVMAVIATPITGAIAIAVVSFNYITSISHWTLGIFLAFTGAFLGVEAVGGACCYALIKCHREKNYGEDFYGRFAHEWKRKLVKATTRGRRGKVEAGHIIIQGRAAYGYRLEQAHGKTTLVPFEPEARIVRLIFNLYVNLDYSLQKITDHLTELQVPTFADTQPGISKKSAGGYGHGQPY